VTNIRAFLLMHRHLAIMAAAAALLMKVLMPAGFMPVVSHGVLIVQLCNGTTNQTVAIEMPGMEHHSQGDDQHIAPDKPCAFAGLAVSMLEGTDPALLAVAIAFILALTFRVERRTVLRRSPHLRPPSHGPPATS
jgi:hypothetical protein